MSGVWYGTLGPDMVGRGLTLYAGVWYGGPDMVGHVPTLLGSNVSRCNLIPICFWSDMFQFYFGKAFETLYVFMVIQI